MLKLSTLLVIPEIVHNCVVSTEKKNQVMEQLSKDSKAYSFQIQINGMTINQGPHQMKQEESSHEKELANLVVALNAEKKRCSDMRTDYERRLIELNRRLDESERRRNEIPKETYFENPQIVDFLHRCSDTWIPRNTVSRTSTEIGEAILSLRNSYFMLRKRIPEIEGLKELDLNIVGATSFCSERMKQLKDGCEDLVGILMVCHI